MRSNALKKIDKVTSREKYRTDFCEEFEQKQAYEQQKEIWETNWLSQEQHIEVKRAPSMDHANLIGRRRTEKVIRHSSFHQPLGHREEDEIKDPRHTLKKSYTCTSYKFATSHTETSL